MYCGAWCLSAAQMPPTDDGPASARARLRAWRELQLDDARNHPPRECRLFRLALEGAGARREMFAELLRSLREEHPFQTQWLPRRGHSTHCDVLRAADESLPFLFRNARYEIPCSRQRG